MKKGTSHFTLLKTVKWEVPFFMMLGLRTGVVFRPLPGAKRSPLQQNLGGFFHGFDFMKFAPG